MDKYRKGEVQELPCDPPFDDELVKDITVMRIKPGTKAVNIVDFAVRHMRNSDNRKILFRGIGRACTKVVSCVELFKRSLNNSESELHQLSKVAFVRVEEFWDPVEENLDRLKVSRNTPIIYVLISKDALPSSTSGYQHFGTSASVTRSESTQDSARSGKLAKKQAANAPAAASSSNRWRRSQKPKHYEKDTYNK